MYFKSKGTKLMWMMVMFDLPTETAQERKSATKFRNFLLDIGFGMTQYSIYTRFTGTKENSEKYIKLIQNNNPSTGDVNILFFTDYQFGEIIHLYRQDKPKKLSKKPDQLQLF